MIRGTLSILADIDGIPTILSCEEINGMMGPEDEGCRYGGRLIFEVKSLDGFRKLAHKALSDYGYIGRNVKVSDVKFKNWTLDSVLTDGIIHSNPVYLTCWNDSDYTYFKNLSTTTVKMRCSIAGETNFSKWTVKPEAIGCKVEELEDNGKFLIVSIPPGGSIILYYDDMLRSFWLERFVETYRRKFAKPDMALPESGVDELRDVLSSIRDTVEIAKKDGNHEIRWFLVNCAERIESILKGVRPMRFEKSKRGEDDE